MVCSFPALAVPTLFLGLLDSLPYTPFVSDDEMSTDDDVIPILKCPLYQQTTSLKAKQISFLVGFVFDGWKTTYGDDVIEVYPPPNICFNSSLQIYDGNDMEIAGEHLLRGLTVDDYFVQIENVSCNISSLSNSRLWFRPSQLVVPDQTYFAQRWQCPNDYPYHVVVTVGGIAQYNAGCIKYSVDMLAINKCNLAEYQCNSHGTCLDGYTSKPYCKCFKQYYGSHCEYDAPILQSIQPDHGTFSGGTTVTVSGKIPSRITPVSAMFNKWSTQIITYSDNQTIVLTTPAAVYIATNEDMNVTVQVLFNDSHSWQVAAPFNYNADPIITGVYPRDHVVTGGTVITISGSGLNISRSPKMAITIVRREPIAGAQSLMFMESVVASPTPNCSLLSSELMQCIMPYIEVPDQFVPLLDTIAADPDFAFYRRRRKRMLTVGDVAKGKNRRSIFAWLRTLRSKLSTKRPVKRRRDLSLVNQSGMSMTVYVLLRFDWLTINASRLLPNVTLLLHNPPTVEVPDSVIPFYPNRGQIIEIRGRHMTLGCNWTADASVTIGGLSIPITNYTASRVHVAPPDVTVGMQSLESTNLIDSVCTPSGETPRWLNFSVIYPLELHIGYGIYPVGCLQYMSVASENIHQRLNVLAAVFHVVLTVIVQFIALR